MFAGDLKDSSFRSCFQPGIVRPFINITFTAASCERGISYVGTFFHLVVHYLLYCICRYGSMIMTQQLAELEEVTQFKLYPERRQIIRDTWWKRLSGCQKVVEDWKQILQVRRV